MNLGTTLSELLLADSAVRALVNTRVYARTMPTTAKFPLLVYHRVSEVPVSRLRGRSLVATVRYQIDCWAVSDTEAEAVEAAVLGALDGFVGRATAADMSVARAGGISLFDEESGLYHNALDLFCVVSEDAA